tara:strand:- start:855 stop:1259 length:405 start_codon:yes stop_codon:yes gene_type:complete
MAHFAQLDKDNNVLQVIVISNDDITDSEGNEVESLGIPICQRLFGQDTIWKQTSYNGTFRKRYAGQGYYYDEELDAFIEKMYPSWVLDKEIAAYVSPIGPPPELTPAEKYAEYVYEWDEKLHQADNTRGWVLKK